MAAEVKSRQDEEESKHLITVWYHVVDVYVFAFEICACRRERPQETNFYFQVISS